MSETTRIRTVFVGRVQAAIFTGRVRKGWRVAPALHPLVVPELEHQERPERLAMVADPSAVLVDPAGDGLGAEEALSRQSVGAEGGVEQPRQLATQPAGHGDAETF